ncbi:MAG TPA: type II secretion system protein [Fimbriimonadaceae bacterium]|nr:type II secretion system protein [Fimbriimonadaceae bacterium]HRJ95499.1 type II secretion system protein [Fimbriimonadaceae bacterium]
MQKRRGFTVVEFMIVILVIGILASIAAPQFMKARESSRAKTCASALKQIESAKSQWALELGKGEDAAPHMNDLVPYVKEWPICMSGGTYTIGKVGEIATCSAGHTY